MRALAMHVPLVGATQCGAFAFKNAGTGNTYAPFMIIRCGATEAGSQVFCCFFCFFLLQGNHVMSTQQVRSEGRGRLAPQWFHTFYPLRSVRELFFF